MMRTKLAFICILFLLLLESVVAVSIGISPGRVRFDDLLQGGYAERSITITTNTEENLVGHFVVRGDIEEWVRFEPDTDQFQVSSKEPYRISIIVEPPVDMPSGNYTGSIEFVTDGIGTIGGRAGGVVKAAVTLLMNAQLTVDENIECTAGAFTLPDAEPNFPLEFATTIRNEGNVRITPTLAVDIWDQLQEDLLITEEISTEVVLPTTQRRLSGKLNHNLDVGQYWARVTATECDTAELMTFSIVEEGEIIDTGILNGIFSKPEASVGETVEFIAKFENKGSRAVTAKFRGNVRLDDTIVKIIDTDEILVEAGETTDFNVFFTPQEPGRYALNGRVTYNKKLTFEKSSVLNVDMQEVEEGGINLIPLTLYLAIIVTILFIVRRILKERKKRHH